MNIKALKEQKVALHEKMKQLTKNEAYSLEEFNRLDGEFEALQKRIESMEKIEAREAADLETYQSSDSGKRTIDNKEATSKAWQKMIIKGESFLNEAERNLIFANSDPLMRAAVQSTTDNAGGYNIPTGFSNEIALAEKYYASVASVARTIKTATGNDIHWPKANDTAVVAYVINEAANHETDATAVTFAESILKSYMVTSGLVRVSLQLLQDSFFDMGSLLSDLFAERFGRGLNALYTTGAGSTTIQGYTVGGADASLSGVAAAAITRDNILDLIHSIDPAYRSKPNFRIVMNDSTLAAVRKLDYGTADARPLYQESAMAGAPNMIEGVPILINPAMASIGASAKSIAVGDFSNYVIREVAGDKLIILRERFADTGQVGFVMLRRRDGQVIDAGANPIKYLVHAAS